MTFAQITTDQVIAGFGTPGAIVIIALVVALIFCVKLILSAYKSRDDLQEQRVIEAREIRDKITAPMETQAELSKKIYDLLVSVLSDKGRK